MDRDAAVAFVRANTTPAPVPLVPDISIYSANEFTPLWQATAKLLDAYETSPFWAFPWAGGQALARYVTDHPETVREKRVFDFGAGSGVVAIAAAKAGARKVTACDIDPLFEAVLSLDCELNNVAIEALTADALGRDLEDTDVVLVGDMFYERRLAEHGLPWLRRLVQSGMLVLCGDPGRIYSPQEGLSTVASYRVPTTVAIEDREVRETRVVRVVSA